MTLSLSLPLPDVLSVRVLKELRNDEFLVTDVFKRKVRGMSKMEMYLRRVGKEVRV